MDIEAFVAALNTGGLQVNNLFQRHDGQWQCNLRSSGPEGKDTFRTFATGRTIAETLKAAVKQPTTQVIFAKDLVRRLSAPKAASYEDLL